MEPQVFICHSSADARTAREICDRLEASGVGCWIAPRDPAPGIPYAEQLVGAIAAVRVVLLVFSSHANESRPVLNEIELAANRGKTILPVLIESVAPSASLEFYIRAIHWFDAATRPLADVWIDLVNDVRSLLGPMTPAPAPEAKAPAATLPPNNLPLQLTSFVGRERTLTEIEGLLKEYRLVTVVGTVGAGKTRAAIQVGAQVLPAFPDGVWLVELAPLSNGALITGAIARVLGVSESTSHPLLDVMLEHLKRQRLLLVIDNCEHVIDDVRVLASAILRSCPEVRTIATSRESLNIAGERVFRLPSLGVPPGGESVTAQTARSFGAVSLFADRAAAADERFELTDDNAPIVAEICRRLDGIPLAIELAAARIKVLSPQQLARRLDERFRMLTGGDRSALPRHQTMRALIDWSYELLTDDERALFRRLSIFADGFTLAGAAAVFTDDRRDEMSVLDLVASLVDKSLLQADPGVQERYRLLESTRQYAREKLTESAELDACARRHLDFLVATFARVGTEYESTISNSSVVGLGLELEDARNALDWSETHAISEAADLFLATRLWDYLGLHREAIERASRLLQRIGDGDPERCAELCERIAQSAGRIGQSSAAKEAAERAMHYARDSKNHDVLSDCLLRYADVMARGHRFDEALKALDEVETLGLQTPRRAYQGLNVRALVGLLSGDLHSAARNYAEVHDLYASLGNDVGTASTTLNWAEIEHQRGATASAIDIVKNELPRAEQLPDRSMWAHLMENLAGYLAATGDAHGAREAAIRAIEFYAVNDPDGAFAAIALEHLALALALTGDARTSAMLEGYAAKTLARLGFQREYTESTSYNRLLEVLRSTLTAAELSERLAYGERLTARDAIATVAGLETVS